MSFDLRADGRLMATGTIRPGTAKVFAAELEKRGNYVKTVLLHSPGGSVSDAIEMGRLIRQQQFATEVESGRYCASSCPLAAAKTGTAVNYISPGPGTIGHLVPELLAHKENLKFAHVAYKGAGQAMTDLVAGHVKMGSMTWSSAISQIRAGTVVPLAVSSARP